MILHGLRSWMALESISGSLAVGASSGYNGLTVNLLVQALYHCPNLRLETAKWTVTAGVVIINVRVVSIVMVVCRQPNPSLLTSVSRNF